MIDKQIYILLMLSFIVLILCIILIELSSIRSEVYSSSFRITDIRNCLIDISDKNKCSMDY